MDDQRQVFKHFCLERYVQGHVHSKTLTKAKGEQIVAVLNDNSTMVEPTKDCGSSSCAIPGLRKVVAQSKDCVITRCAQSWDCIRQIRNPKIGTQSHDSEIVLCNLKIA